MKILLPLLLISTLLVSCGKKSGPDESPKLGGVTQPTTGETEPEETKPKLIELEAGEFNVTCFFNKAASAKYGQEIHVLATFKVDSQAGQSNFSAHLKSDCSDRPNPPIREGHLDIRSYQTKIIDDVTVLEMGLRDIAIYIPYSISKKGIFMDLSQLDAESERDQELPSEEQLEKFRKDPQSYTKLSQRK